MSGKQTTCVKCGKDLVVPAQTKPVDVPPPPPIPEDTSPPLSDFTPAPPAETTVSESPSESPRPAGLRKMQPSRSWWDLFDWKFEKYLTPWIIRFTWALAVTWTLIVILLLSFSVVSSAFESEKKPQFDSQSQADIDMLLQSLSPQEKSTGARWAWKLIGYGTAVVLSVLALLWTRVVLECLIVVFNIAETATSIDDSLKRQLARDRAVRL
jgi:hypothetical protein